jgi:hypothetical protein
MWKDSIRNIVVIFQTTILRFVGFYVRRSANQEQIERGLVNVLCQKTGITDEKPQSLFIYRISFCLRSNKYLRINSASSSSIRM